MRKPIIILATTFLVLIPLTLIFLKMNFGKPPVEGALSPVEACLLILNQEPYDAHNPKYLHPSENKVLLRSDGTYVIEIPFNTSDQDGTIHYSKNICYLRKNGRYWEVIEVM